MPLLLLSALLHLYVGLRIVPALESAWTALAVGLLLVTSMGVIPFSRRSVRLRNAAWADLLVVAGLWFIGLFSSLFVLTVLREVLLLGGWMVLAVRPRAFEPGAWAAMTAAAVPLLALVVTLIGFVNARRTARVRSVDVPIAGLPDALHGFTIAQISDVHVGPTIRERYLDAIVARVNRIGADMIAVTGDLVDGPVTRLRAHVAPLARLASRHGTYFVTGNHEYYSGVLGWIAELRRLGLQVLLNEHVVLQHDEASVVVAGVTDYGAHHFAEHHRSDPAAALSGAPAEAAVRILLAHQPRSAHAAERAGFDLQLSGHTHGGQFWPWNLLVRLQQPFTAGLHRWRALWVYTSRGTGYWGPLNRFGAPSEITRLRLVPER